MTSNIIRSATVYLPMHDCQTKTFTVGQNTYEFSSSKSRIAYRVKSIYEYPETNCIRIVAENGMFIDFANIPYSLKGDC
ncbi:hypothetical protein DFP96_1018 [Listeria rocourtiae]|uniref:Uncharacterized protein n=1 Tax=Listeria rocourtiae TaxID=647910 RepID=A0A4R6ZRP4_9LIST|nr:hypothetical protein PROCOU_14063 [Listeria rocourtiae FSL F6-920]TDR55082.1 hypothetical protein DFP96_1018 [Listeria rocourtiae]